MEGLDGDILPRTKVSDGSGTSAAIQNGELYLNGVATGKTLGEFAKRDFLNSNITVAQAKQQANFKIEPGKCTRSQLFAISDSSIASPLPEKVICIKRVYKQFITSLR